MDGRGIRVLTAKIEFALLKEKKLGTTRSLAVAKNSIILIMTWLTFVVVETYRKINKDRTQVWKFLLPILRPFSVIGLAVCGLSGDGI